MPAGAPEGNRNARKETRRWSETISRVIAQDPDKLRKAAEALVDAAAAGDLQAIKELGDRLDGKPNQSISNPDGSGLFEPILLSSILMRQKLQVVETLKLEDKAA